MMRADVYVSVSYLMCRDLPRRSSNDGFQKLLGSDTGSVNVARRLFEVICMWLSRT